MPIGKGNYGDLCEFVREQSKASGAAVIIHDGEKGSGFAVQGDFLFQTSLPDILEHMAKQIRADLEAAAGHA